MTNKLVINLETLFEEMHQYLECHEVWTLLSVSKHIRETIPHLNTTQNSQGPRRMTVVRFGLVRDWDIFRSWMVTFRFEVGSLILKTPVEAVSYFTSALFEKSA